jgi:hypothetical protein
MKNEGHRNGSGSTHTRKRDVPVLEDFELVRVIGKGCAGRVSRSHSCEDIDMTDDRS